MPRPQDDQAVGGGEANQVRDDGEHGGRGVDTYWLVIVLCGHEATGTTGTIKPRYDRTGKTADRCSELALDS
jgi:hypothetical protein